MVSRGTFRGQRNSLQPFDIISSFTLLGPFTHPLSSRPSADHDVSVEHMNAKKKQS